MRLRRVRACVSQRRTFAKRFLTVGQRRVPVARTKELRPIPRRDCTEIEFVLFADSRALAALFEFISRRELHGRETQTAQHRGVHEGGWSEKIGCWLSAVGDRLSAGKVEPTTRG